MRWCDVRTRAAPPGKPGDARRDEGKAKDRRRWPGRSEARVSDRRKRPCRQVRPVSAQIRSRDSMAPALDWQRHWEDKDRVRLWDKVAGMDNRWPVMIGKVSFEMMKVAGTVLPSALVSFRQWRRSEEGQRRLSVEDRQDLKVTRW